MRLTIDSCIIPKLMASNLSQNGLHKSNNTMIRLLYETLTLSIE